MTRWWRVFRQPMKPVVLLNWWFTMNRTCWNTFHHLW